jgi:hypothetical protein
VINDDLGVSEFLSYALAVQPTRLRFLRMIDDVKGHRIDDALIVLNESSSILFEPANLDGVAQWTLIGRAERLVIRPDVIGESPEKALLILARMADEDLRIDVTPPHNRRNSTSRAVHQSLTLAGCNGCGDLLHSYGPSATAIASPRSSLSFRIEVNALVDTLAPAPAVLSADVLLQRTGELPKRPFDRRQLWWSGRPGTQPGAVNRQLEEPLVHKHPRGVTVRQQVARAVELETRPRTLARILRSQRQGSEKLSQRLDEEGHRVYGGTAQRL